MATQGMKNRARDNAMPIHTHCAQHGTALDAKRRCADCKAEALADLADND